MNDEGDVEIVGRVQDVREIASGRSVRALARLRRSYGPGRWRKMKATAFVRLPDGTVRRAEVHWYEAQGVGRKEMKFKRLV